MTKHTKILLTVVGISCLPIAILILMVLTIPATQAVIRHANETSAINTLRFLNTEEQNYLEMYPQHGYACSLAQLGGSPQSGPETANAAQLIPDDLAGGQKAGYTFMVGNCAKEKDAVISYKITAVPKEVGHSGNRGFCIDQTGRMTVDPRGGTNCTELLQ
jgi:type IV pilus assembly protein PilA